MGQEIKTWYYYDDYFTDDDGVIKWHNEESHKKFKAQKASIKEELLPIAWQPLRYYDWCVPRIKNKRKKIVDIRHGSFCI